MTPHQTESVHEPGADSAVEPALGLRISGMTCASCVARVHDRLRALEGVAEAEVDLVSAEAWLTGDGAAPLAPEAAIAAVAAAGYRAEAIAPDAVSAPRPSPDHPASPGLALLVGIVATVILAAAVWTPVLALPPILLAGLSGLALASAGAGIFRAAWHALRAGSATMDVLVALGGGVAFIASLAAVLTGRAESWPLHFHSAALVISFVAFGRWLEGHVQARALRATDLWWTESWPPARVRRGDRIEEIPVEDLRPGDRLLLRPGERIPVDGTILSGEGAVDEALLTGESQGIAKAPGDPVHGGTVCQDAAMEIEATSAFAATAHARLAKMVQRARRARPQVQRRVDRAAAVFVPAVLVLAAVTFLGWAWLAGDVEGGLIAAVAVLVIACPCALGLATPMAIVAGAGIAARHGLLIKSADVFERSRRLREVYLDKTGTVTRGQPRVLASGALDGEDDRLGARAAALARHSGHPASRAIVGAAGGGDLEARDVRERPGLGVDGRLGDESLFLGQPDAVADRIGTPLPDAATKGDGSLVVLARLAPNPAWLGWFRIASDLDPQAGDAIARLVAMHLSPRLLSGDSSAATAATAGELGIEGWRARQSPADKCAVLQRARAEGRPIAFAGDGLNDGPALAAADIGIAVGGASALAADAADIAILQRGTGSIADALDIVRRTDRNILQNLFWACIFNGAALPLAAFGVLAPGLAGAAMALSSLIVVLNALRLARWRPRFAAAIGRSGAPATP